MISFKEYLEEGKRGLWDNIHAKQERIKHGSGEKMRKPGSKGAPTAADFKASEATSKNEEVELEEGYDKSSEHHKNARKMAKDYDGKATFHPNGHAEVRMRSIVHGHSTVNPHGTTLMSGEDLAKRASKEHGKGKVKGNVVHFKEEVELEEGTFKYHMDKAVAAHMKGDSKKAMYHLDNAKTARYAMSTKNYPKNKDLLDKYKKMTEEVDLGEDAKGYKNPTGGLTQKGRDHYNNQTGGHLKAPVTTPPSKLDPDSKAAKRRKSFCARMSGVEGPMKKPNGEPTRKALALRKWNC